MDAAKDVIEALVPVPTDAGAKEEGEEKDAGDDEVNGKIADAAVDASTGIVECRLEDVIDLDSVTCGHTVQLTRLPPPPPETLEADENTRFILEPVPSGPEDTLTIPSALAVDIIEFVEVVVLAVDVVSFVTQVVVTDDVAVDAGDTLVVQVLVPVHVLTVDVIVTDDGKMLLQADVAKVHISFGTFDDDDD